MSSLVTAIAAFIVFWPLAGYPALLSLLAALRGRTRPAAGGALPSMTVILPTYQERSNIEARLRNLAEVDYPRDLLDVVVIDSGSTDGTAEAVDAIDARLAGLRVRLLRQASREGKAAAINLGITAATGELVVVTDAPTLFSPDALERVADRFADPAIGAATGSFEVTGADGPVQREEARFWRLRNRLRSLEAAVDSTPFLSGELTCFRRGLVRKLDEDTLADDMNIALQVRRQGYRVITCDDVHFREPRSNAAAELVETKSRRAAGGAQELLRARGMIFNPRFGLFGLLILPTAMLFYLPLRTPAALVLCAAAWRWCRRLPGVVRLAAAGAIAVAAFASPRRRWEAVAMLVFNEWIFLLGWRRILGNRMDVRWTQERSTRGAAQCSRDVGAA